MPQVRLARRRVALTDQERRDWAAYVRLIRPLPGRAVPPLADAPAAPDPPDRPVLLLARSGKLTPERTLDLHGRTAQRAFHALHAFLHAAYTEGVRCVEIITGRGTGESGGVLRRELPLWLNLPSLRPIVLAATHPHALNQGAVRVLLRRAR
jgi:DNA-nicking Smr family endonuclease